MKFARNNQTNGKSLRENPAMTVIGAGPVGLASALLLKKRGLEPLVLERNPRSEAQENASSSFNVTLTLPSVHFLWELGINLAGATLEISKRSIWTAQGAYSHRYGLQKSDRLYSIPRSTLVNLLRNEAVRCGVEIVDDAEMVSLDARRGIIRIAKCGSSLATISSDRIVVADGANSRGREEIVRQADCNFERKTDGCVYAVARIPADTTPANHLDPHAIHFATAPGAMDVAIGNIDGSFSVLLERQTDEGVPDSTNGWNVSKFLAQAPPYLQRFIPDLEEQIKAGPLRRFKYTHSDRQFFGKAVLLGDANRCFPPYLGQGLNAGLKDASAIAVAVDASFGDWSVATGLYEKERRLRTHRLTELARNYGRMITMGHFGCGWRVKDRVARVAEALFGYRTIYQQLCFDSAFPTVASILDANSDAPPALAGLPLY